MLLKMKSKVLEEFCDMDFEILSFVAGESFVKFLKEKLLEIKPEWEGSAEIAIQEYDDILCVCVIDNAEPKATIFEYEKRTKRNIEKELTVNEILLIAETMGYIEGGVKDE